MPESLRNAIDLGLVSEDARSFLFAEGYGQLSWSILRKQYKNIEEGLADRMIADRVNHRREGLMSYATATRDEFDSAVDLIVDYERRLSCNGSIYDRLPEDAFSDTKPMTLMEYYVWQDAIALFIENTAKYFPNSLSEYRGLSEHKIKSYFGTYLYEKIRIEYNRLPEFTGYRHCEDFKNYAEKNPFVLYFADKYFRKTFVPFGTFDEKVIPWEPDNFADIMRSERDLWSHNPGLLTILFELEGNDSNKINVLHIVPRYTVKDGRLAFWRESNPHNRTTDAAGTMEDFFSIFPEKRSEFDAKVIAYKQQLSEKVEIKRKEQSCKQAIEQNDNAIKAKKNEITQLQKKIFGKKAALVKATELEKEIFNLQENNAKMVESLNTYSSRLKQIVDEEQFYEQLAEEMNYFIAWRWVDDEKRSPFWLSEKDKQKQKQLNCTLTNLEIQDMIMETIKILGTESTISDILKANVALEENCSVVKIAVMLRQLVDNQKLQRIERDGKAYFSII